MVMEERHDDFDTTFALLKSRLMTGAVRPAAKIKQKNMTPGARIAGLKTIRQFQPHARGLLKILIDYFRALETCIGREITTKDVFQYTRP